jgi:hypothetical protein
MKALDFSEYVAIRERERSLTVQTLLAEIEGLKVQLASLALAYNKLKKINNIDGDKHHKAGFEIKEKK